MQRLSDLTPGNHPDYLPSISLYHAARTIVYVLREVKAREEEYEFVKDISGKICDLQSSVQLARRERRLLWHGDLLWPSGQSSEPNGRHAVLSPGSNSRSGSMPAIVLSPCPDSPALSKSSRRRSPRPHDGATPVHVLAFTDVVLFAVSASDGRSWQLLQDVGISKILIFSSEVASGTFQCNSRGALGSYFAIQVLLPA